MRAGNSGVVVWGQVFSGVYKTKVYVVLPSPISSARMPGTHIQ
jgi:hypothetical protein